MTDLPPDIFARVQAASKKISRRAQETRKVSSMDVAIELARSLLQENAQFGGATLRDEEVAGILQELGIGVSTFKKALRKARTELTRAPRRKKRQQSPKTAAVTPSKKASTENHAGKISHSSENRSQRLAEETDRSLL